MVFNATQHYFSYIMAVSLLVEETFNTISAISWQSVLLVEETTQYFSYIVVVSNNISVISWRSVFIGGGNRAQQYFSYIVAIRFIG